jgi:hypothetical protein
MLLAISIAFANRNCPCLLPKVPALLRLSVVIKATRSAQYLLRALKMLNPSVRHLFHTSPQGTILPNKSICIFSRLYRFKERLPNGVAQLN